MRKTLVVALALSSIFSASACSSEASAENKAPKSLIGEWRQDGIGNPDAYMTASVASGSIQINMKTRDSSSLYWLGTFDSDNDPTSEFQVISQADQDALALSIFGSSDESKVFTYRTGVISFDFSMMGTTTTVRLVK